MMESDRLTSAWLLAARRLEIEVHAPFDLVDSNSIIRCAAYLPGFGSPMGAVVSILGSNNAVIKEAAKRQGLFYSFLSDTYCSFEKSRFIALLDDWGWHGNQTDAPDWYTGRSWIQRE
jgi:hypothetical protein